MIKISKPNVFSTSCECVLFQMLNWSYWLAANLFVAIEKILLLCVDV